MTSKQTSGMSAFGPKSVSLRLRTTIPLYTRKQTRQAQRSHNSVAVAPRAFCSSRGPREIASRPRTISPLLPARHCHHHAETGGRKRLPSSRWWNAPFVPAQLSAAVRVAEGVTQVQANQVMSSFKLSLKQNVRNVFARPEKYAPRSTATQDAPTPQDIPPPHPGCSSYKRYDGATVYINCPKR